MWIGRENILRNQCGLSKDGCEYCRVKSSTPQPMPRNLSICLGEVILVDILGENIEQE